MSQHLLLVRMEAAHQLTQRQLDLIHRQIAMRTERLTVTDKAKARSHRRGRTNWTRSDEQMFHDHLDRLTFERRFEFDALSRKLTRQEYAIVLVRKKLDVELDAEVH
jgi:hypothetical protein